MTMRPAARIRLLVVVAAIALAFGLLLVSVALRDRVEIANQNIVVEANEVAETTEVSGDSKKSGKQNENDGPTRWEPTEFYDDSLIPDAPSLAKVAFTEEQVSRESILPMYLLHESDLLADYCLIPERDLITDEQVIEAKLLAQRFDSRLKDLRRERGKIMEHSGVTLKDPTQELEKIRIKTYFLLVEARSTILQEVLTNEQRQMIFQRAYPESFALRSRLIDERRGLYEERERLIKKRDQHLANKEGVEMRATQKLVLENLDSILRLEKKFKDLNSKQAETNRDSLIKNPTSER